MIYELRTYTIKAGGIPTVVKHSGEVGRQVRGDNYGKLEGYWFTDIGPLNQVIHLWSWESLDERTRLRGELAKNKAWNEDYIPVLRPLMIKQHVRILDAVLPIKAPAEGGNVYEMRYYSTHTGGAKAWAKLIREVMPAREKHSPYCAIFTGDSPDPNEVIHIWPFKDLVERARVRAACMEDDAWKAYLGKAVHLMREMANQIMLPAPHSPLR